MTNTEAPSGPRFEDLCAAQDRLAGVAVRTPLIASPDLDAAAGGRVLLKAEILQRTGSFKFRGAYNAIAALGEEGRSKGVAACSSGNHAQGVAAAAALFGTPATIVMPHDAPAPKRQRTQDLGARIVGYDRATESREAIAGEIVAQTGAAFIAPYDDPFVIAGQGTAGIEIVEQARELGLVPDMVLVPCSGGGLTAGIALALEALSPDCAIFTVEPAGFDDYARSLEAGERKENARPAGSVCDALLAPGPGQLTFAINRERVAGGLVVSDEEALAAVAYAWRELRLVVEPGGAAGLAAVLSGRIDTRGRTVAVVLSGGNVDPSLYCRIIAPAVS
jgi:threonine dehydratase